MSEWYEIDAAWNANDYASDALLKLGESDEWGDLVDVASKGTHATAEEVWDGMAKALRGYLESLDEPDAIRNELADGGLIADVLAPVCVDEKERRAFERGRIHERFAQQIFKEATS